MAVTIDDSAPGPDPRSAAVSPTRGDILITEARRAARQWGLDDPRPVIAATQAVLATLQQVEGSTPLDSPPPADEAIVHRCPPSGSSVMPCCGRTPFEATGDRMTVDPAHVTCAVPEVWPPDMRSRRQGGRGPMALHELVLDPQHEPNEHGWGRIESVTPQPAGEPVPVPPPVDALLNLVERFGDNRFDIGRSSATRDDDEPPTIAEQRAEDEALMAVNAALTRLWAAGVEEGRRQRDAEIHANVFTSARLAAAEAGFAPAPESVTVSYERRASAYEQGIYDTGIAEGRRQATEERTEEAVRLDVSLNSPEYRTQLLKMIRNGQIVLPDADHG